MMFHFIGSISPTAWANGIALTVLVYYTAKTSGAHLNPALSLAFFLMGYTNPIELVCYWAAQISGCIMGALWIACLVPGLGPGATISRVGDGPFYDGCFVPRNDMSNADVFAWEAFSTFCFLTPIFSVVWYTLNKKGYGNTGPIIIGLSLLANALATGPFTGAALNPARVLASPSVFNCPNEDHIWYYVAGEMLAGVVVPIAIMPWYGISPTAWYKAWIPSSLLSKLKGFRNEEVLNADIEKQDDADQERDDESREDG
jgi:glycerol uptake facilitator-like aquaporin